MPKERRIRPLSFGSRASPYDKLSTDKPKGFEDVSPALEGTKQWDDVLCPICMEPPHNAVFLRCSSSEKGCKPYICDTSPRLSNCLDQLCKSSGRPQEIMGTTGSSHGGDLKLNCPLCRGEVYGYTKVKEAREFMNLKVRSCSHDTCKFSGTYSELRNHARVEHPEVRPRDVDPRLISDWEITERETELQDVLSMLEMDGEYESPHVDADSSMRQYLFECLFFDAYVALEATAALLDGNARELDSTMPHPGAMDDTGAQAQNRRLVNVVVDFRDQQGPPRIEVEGNRGSVESLRRRQWTQQQQGFQDAGNLPQPFERARRRRSPMVRRPLTGGRRMRATRITEEAVGRRREWPVSPFGLLLESGEPMAGANGRPTGGGRRSRRLGSNERRTRFWPF